MAEQEKGKKKKGRKILFFTAFLIIMAIIAFFMSSLFVSATSAAILYIESGSVEVFDGKSWKIAEDEMELKLNYGVRTLSDSSASVAFFEGEIIRLEENTEISIKELNEKEITINQVTGFTWNKITKLSGIEDYSIETPTTVATVRGTEFAVIIDGETKIMVKDGTVRLKMEGDEIDVSTNEKVIARLKEKLSKTAMTDEDRNLMIRNKDKDITILKKLRGREIDRKKVMVSVFKRVTKMTDEDIRKGLEDIDEGRVDENELIVKSPVKVPNIDRIIKITNEIKTIKGTAVNSTRMISDTIKDTENITANQKNTSISIVKEDVDERTTDSSLSSVY